MCVKFGSVPMANNSLAEGECPICLPFKVQGLTAGFSLAEPLLFLLILGCIDNWSGHLFFLMHYAKICLIHAAKIVWLYHTFIA